MNLTSWKFFLSSLLLLLVFSSNRVLSNPLQEIKIGVLAKEGTEIALQKWNPTAEYLNQRLQGYQFKIVPMEFDEIPLLVDKGLVDFAIVNSSIYVDLSVRFGLRRILTLKNRYNPEQQTTEFGSVIFTRADNTHIHKLIDLKGQKLAAVHPTSFGGWIIAIREIIDAGLTLNDLSEVYFENTHNAVVQNVVDRNVEAGIIRTDTLERLATTTGFDISQLRILNEQKKSGFPFKLSTRLYPEWPIAKLEHTSSHLARSVAIAMIQMPEQSNAAIAADINGWTIPENYQPVHEILRELKLAPYQYYGEITLGKIFSTYGYWLFAILAIVFFQSTLIARVFNLNKKLRKQQSELSQSEERFKATFDQAAVGILHVSINGKLLKVNQKFCKNLGYSETEILKFNFNDFFESTEISEEFHKLDNMRQNKIESFTYQKKYRRKDGQQIDCLTSISCIRSIDGSIKYLVAVVNDVSELIDPGKDISDQEKQNQLIHDSADECILRVDSNGIFTYVPHYATSIFGWEVDEMIDKDHHLLWNHSYSREDNFATQDSPVEQILITGNSYEALDEVLQRKDGSSFQAELIGTPIFESGVITGAMLVVRLIPPLE